MDEDVVKGRQEFRREAGDALVANLKRLRAKSGLSQENLSLKASLTRTHVGLIEKGERFPEVDTVYRLAGALGVEPSELIAGLYWRPDNSKIGGHATNEPPQGRVES